MADTLSTSPPTRVCLITETYFPVIGGGEVQARATMIGLRERGFDTEVVTRRSEAEFLANETVDGVKITRLNPSGAGQLKKWMMLPGLRSYLQSREFEADVLLVSGYRVLGIAAMQAGRRRGVPVILKGDNTGEFSGAYFAGGAARLGLDRIPGLVNGIVAMRNRLLRKADAFVVLSSEMREELTSHGIDPQRIVEIPNSVDMNRFHRRADSPGAARVALGLPDKGPIIIFTGRLLETKGLLELVRVWKRIAPDYPDAHLVIVGGGGELMYSCEAALRSFIGDNDLEGSITITGFVRNVEDYLNAADIFAFPTWDEAFGISLIEAMAVGLAVVATPVGGIRDIVDHEQNGLFCEKSNEPALEAALRRLLDDATLRKRLGQAAVATVAERYTTEAVVGGYAALIRRLVDGKAGANLMDSDDVTAPRRHRCAKVGSQ